MRVNNITPQWMKDQQKESDKQLKEIRPEIRQIAGQLTMIILHDLQLIDAQTKGCGKPTCLDCEGCDG